MCGEGVDGRPNRRRSLGILCTTRRAREGRLASYGEKAPCGCSFGAKASINDGISDLTNPGHATIYGAISGAR